MDQAIYSIQELMQLYGQTRQNIFHKVRKGDIEHIGRNQYRILRNHPRCLVIEYDYDESLRLTEYAHQIGIDTDDYLARLKFTTLALHPRDLLTRKRGEG